MADYYSILNKTISGLAQNTPEVRQAVYSKARSAIEAQLRRMDPPPGEAVIAAQLELLEEAILVIDSEHAPDLVAEELDAIIEIEEPTTVKEVAPEAEPVQPEAAVVAPVEMPSVESTVEPAAEPTVVSDVPPEEPKKKSRKLVKLLVYLLIVGVVGGAAYGAWLNRSALEPMIASILGDGETDVAGSPEAASANVSESSEAEQPSNDETEIAATDKEPVRLGADGEDQQADEPVETDSELESTEVPVVLEPEEDQSVISESEPEVSPVDEGNAEENASASEEQPESSALGEVAYLYEEGSAGSGATRSTATISWALARVKPSETLPPEPVIIGNMEVPEKGLSIELNLKRNVDPALSASHLIELTFEVPNEFPGGGIDNIARFVMKPTEEARGEPLVAVPVKVSDGYFLIALDNLDQAVELNEQLLLSSGWIDVPIAYNTGKRALLTLEKGGTGDQVFKDAFNDWKNR